MVVHLIPPNFKGIRINLLFTFAAMLRAMSEAEARGRPWRARYILALGVFSVIGAIVKSAYHVIGAGSVGKAADRITKDVES